MGSSWQETVNQPWPRTISTPGVSPSRTQPRPTMSLSRNVPRDAAGTVVLARPQVSQPWKSVAASADAPATRGQFTGFGQPGYAKIATGLRIDPYGTGSSILTIETRVAITDETSLCRFRRYWALIGPFSFFMRRMALRQLADELRRANRQDRRGAA